MITKAIIGNELYLYNAKGQLIFKRWLDQSRSVVFDIMTYSKDTLTSITEENGKLKFSHNGSTQHNSSCIS